MKKTINEQITERIEMMEKSAVFMTADFKDIAKLSTIRKVLSRLEEKHLIIRVMNGVYYRPPSNKAKKVDPDNVAHALAKRYHWTIAPSGNGALVKLGLLAHPYNSYCYVSDGPYRCYQLDGTTITFQHRTNRQITNMSIETLLVIESLKALSKDNVDQKIISKLRKTFTKSQKKQILQEAIDSSEWIYRIIQEICL